MRSERAEAGIGKGRLRQIVNQVQADLADYARDGSNQLEIENLSHVIGESVADVTQYMDDVDSATRVEIARIVTNDFLAYGPLQPYLENDRVTEIMVNGCESVYIEMDGVVSAVGRRLFDDDADVRRLIDKIASPLNKHCDNQMPYMDARLADGSRVNAIIPPLSRFGPSLTIRKFPKRRLNADDLVNMGAASAELMDFLACAVESRCNILVSGGTGTGKTTLLNILSSFIPQTERVITVEDTAELQLPLENWVSLEARDANADGSGEISIHQLVINSLRMRPDRIIVGECRSDETVEMLQAMNTGHDGSLTTIHANDPRSAFLRIETLVQAAQNLSEHTIDMQIASAIHLIVQLRRYRDGSRRISEVVALTGGMEGGTITTSTLFEYVEEGVSHTGEVIGVHRATGYSVPESIRERIRRSGAYYDENWLMPYGSGEFSW